jgi:hypothetical protein
LARALAARVLSEARQVVAPTLYFFIGFNFIVLTNHLLVAHYVVLSAASCSRRWQSLSSARRCRLPTTCPLFAITIELLWSNRSFTRRWFIVMLLFSISETGVKGTAPVITIPAQ